MFYGRIINSTISNAITNVGSASGQISLQLQTTSAGAPSVPERARQRIGHAGQARRRRLRRRHAEPDGARVGRHRSNSGSVRARWCRFPTSAAPAATCRSSSTRTFRSPRARSATPRSADLSTARRSRRRSSPAHDRMRTSGASRRFRPLVDSKYNGLVLQLNRRLNKGLQFQASYTEARATDNGQSSQTFTSANNVLNPFELGLEEATSNFEIRHRFVANAIWSPKVGAEGTTMNAIFSGFTISPTLAMTSGVPYTATLTATRRTPLVSRPVSSAPAARTGCPRSSETPITCRRRPTSTCGSRAPSGSRERTRPKSSSTSSTSRTV